MRKFNKGKFQEKKGLTIETEVWTGGNPSKEKISTGSDKLEYRAFRDLKFTGAIETKADPNSEAAKGSYPYRILNSNNRVVEANYPGYDNIGGNAIVKLQNSQQTQFLNLIDSIVMEKRLNYNYLAIDSSTTAISGHNPNAVNIAYNIEMLKALEQALSTGYSTMLTQLPFYTDACLTNLPRGGVNSPIYSSNPFDDTDSTTIAQGNDTYAKMGALLFYQITMQNLVSPMAKYTELMSEEQEIMNVSYRREAPYIQQLFGQLKKKAFVAQMNAVGTSVLGEYFDTNWWTQMNAFRHVPSRKACDMNNPMITVVSSHVSPDIKLFAGTANVKYFDSTENGSKGFRIASTVLLDPETFKFETYTDLTLEQCVLNLNKLLDYHYIVRWARRVNNGFITDPTQYAMSASQYYRQVCNYLDSLNWYASRFSSNMNEIRTFLDKMSQTGMIYWRKGQKFDISRCSSIPVTYNQITADVLKNSLAGADAVYYDDITKRWGCSTEWNMYTGINEYDAKSGGSFFTFALRDINRTYTDTQGNTNTIAEHDSRMLLPILFDNLPVTFNYTGTPDYPTTQYYPSFVYAVNRLGLKINLGYHIYTNANINASPVLARLNPIFDTSLSIKTPNFNLAAAIADNGNLSSVEQARLANMINKVLLQTCGYASVYINSGLVEEADPDLLAFIDLQLEDISNEMITYARNYSPFRVATPDGKRTMGFGK